MLSECLLIAGNVLISQSYKYSWKLWGISQSDSLMWDFKNGCFLRPPYLGTKRLHEGTSGGHGQLLRYSPPGRGLYNYITCRSLLTGQGDEHSHTSHRTNKRWVQLCCTYTQALPVPCQKGSNLASARAENPCRAIPNNWVLLSHSCPGRHSCFQRTHWCELLLDPLQSAGTDKQTNRTIPPLCHVPFCQAAWDFNRDTA